MIQMFLLVHVSSVLMLTAVTVTTGGVVVVHDEPVGQWIVLDFKGSFLLSTHTITKCILTFGVECMLS